jgi:AraC family transcriptional regulator
MTNLEYSRRMNRVLDYIDRHLDAPLGLDELAGVAHFSPFHFHRVCAGWLGETLGDYLQRRRLAVGAALLAARPADSVLSVALAVGFGSGEAFARAFKRQFGCTPSAWRQQTPARWAEQLGAARARGAHQRNLDQAERNPDQAAAAEFTDHEHSPTNTTEHIMNVRFVDFPATRVAYLRTIGPYGPALGRFVGEVFMPWLRAQGLERRGWYGVTHDDPSITAPEKCRFDACVAVPEGYTPSGQAMLTTLPGGRYAVASFQGTAAAIGDAWTEMFRDWLPNSGMQCDARPVFDHYRPDSRVDPATGIFDCELCIPVRPL